MAGTGTFLIDLDDERVGVAIDKDAPDALTVARGLALLPQLLAASRKEPRPSCLERALQRLFVHVANHQDVSRRRLLHDRRDEPVRVETDRDTALVKIAGGSTFRRFAHR